jgi:hypothetical protein
MKQHELKDMNPKSEPRRRVEAVIHQRTREPETEENLIPHVTNEITIGNQTSLANGYRMLNTQRNEALLSLQQTYGNRYFQNLVNNHKPVTPDVDTIGKIEKCRGSGEPLECKVRSNMEASFQHNFSNVIIHRDAEADELSKNLGAKAFTIGEDVFFKEGAYNPNSETGVGLIAHELTHVVQHTSGQGLIMPSLMPDITPEVEREIKDWLKAKKGALTILTSESIRKLIRDQITSAKSLTDDELQGAIDRWQRTENIMQGITPSPAPLGTPPPAPGKEVARSSALADKVRQIINVFSKIPTQINIAGDLITIDTGGTTAKLKAGKATLTAAAGWSGEFKVGAVYRGSGALAAGQNVYLSASVNDKKYSISLRIGPQVTAIDKLPDIVKGAEEGLRGLLSDVGSLSLSSLDAVKNSIGQISDHVKPIKEAVDACSKIEGERTGKAPPVSFSLTAQFPREKGTTSVMGLLTFHF